MTQLWNQFLQGLTHSISAYQPKQYFPVAARRPRRVLRIQTAMQHTTNGRESQKGRLGTTTAAPQQSDRDRPRGDVRPRSSAVCYNISQPRKSPRERPLMHAYSDLIYSSTTLSLRALGEVSKNAADALQSSAATSIVNGSSNGAVTEGHTSSWNVFDV